MTQITDKIWAADVPAGAAGFEIDNPLSVGDLVFYLGFPSVFNFRKISLPPGTWRFLFTTKAATEEDARKVVKSLPCGRKKIYKGVKDGNDVWYNSSLESLASLLRSKGLDDKNNYALIEKLK